MPAVLDTHAAIWYLLDTKNLSETVFSLIDGAAASGVLSGKARPRRQKHDFAFSGLLRCAYDNCAVTAEFKKQKYTYYRCTGHRGKCDLPYFREEAMAERLGQVLQAIHIPETFWRSSKSPCLTIKAARERLGANKPNDSANG